jgi:phosphoadenosine phosphosulfate reductase
VRKTHPLKRVLSTADVWICGLRREQAVTRAEVKPVEWDSVHDMVKVNPLFDWSENDVWKHVTEHEIPYCILHDRGYRSIGCQPCTRAVDPQDDVRAGRWWWEAPEQKECGLHSCKDA